MRWRKRVLSCERMYSDGRNVESLKRWNHWSRWDKSEFKRFQARSASSAVWLFTPKLEFASVKNLLDPTLIWKYNWVAMPTILACSESPGTGVREIQRTQRFKLDNKQTILSYPILSYPSPIACRMSTTARPKQRGRQISKVLLMHKTHWPGVS